MADITLEQVTTICGNYTSKNGVNYTFRCPICSEEGHDKKGDNLIYNSDRHIIKCFANQNHTLEILSRINKQYPIKREYKEFVPKIYEPPIWEIRQSKYLEYLLLAQEKLMFNRELLKYIKDKRGLTEKTLDLCGIGFDDTENCFTIPIFSLKHDCITDFELRQYGEKKIRRIGGGCATIAKIWGLSKAKTLYIVEGFIDGMTLTQWLLEKNQKDFTVYSCSNGVGSLLGCMREINFSNFNEIKLILDNDEAGDGVTNAIINKYPFIKDSRKFLKDSGLNDVNEFYVEKVR